MRSRRSDYRCDGRVLALNSYENRVYQIGIEDGEPVVAKFYRPARWSDAAIREEHAFAAELAAQEIPVVAPLVARRRDSALPSRVSLRDFSAPRGSLAGTRNEPTSGSGWAGSWVAFTPSAAPRRFVSGRASRVEELGRKARDFVLDGDWMPDYLATKYADLTDALLEEVEARARGWRGAALGRILGDCHRGNILWTDLGPHFVDLDDCVTGPAIQDLWMLLAGSQQEMRTELTDLLKGYEQFLPFDRRELALIEPLRALRMIHYSAWLARRWDDPAFPKAFPWFAEPRYWEEHYRALEEQLAAVLGPPLEL